MVVHTCSPRTWEAEAGALLLVEASLGETLSQKPKEKNILRLWGRGLETNPRNFTFVCVDWDQNFCIK